jgi:hypothetical protein
LHLFRKRAFVLDYNRLSTDVIVRLSSYLSTFFNFNQHSGFKQVLQVHWHFRTSELVQCTAFWKGCQIAYETTNLAFTIRTPCCLIWFPKFPFSLTLRLIINTELKNEYETNMNYIDDIHYRIHFICILNATSSLTLHKW